MTIWTWKELAIIWAPFTIYVVWFLVCFFMMGQFWHSIEQVVHEWTARHR